MLTDQFFHPYYVVPTVEFIAAFVKFPYQAIAHVTVKFNAVFVQIFIISRGIGDAGVHIQDSLFFQGRFQGIMEFLSDSSVADILIYIDRSFHCPVISRTVM